MLVPLVPLVLLAVLSPGSPGPVLQSRSRCEVDRRQQRVDCSDRGLVHVPRNLSVFTSYLDLSMNNLTHLSERALANLHFLEELRLAGNDLSFIHKDAFDGLYNLKVLMLQNNHLRSVPAEAFNNLRNLQSLRLDANLLSVVPSSSFLGLRALRHLWLDDNALTEVPVDALREVVALQAVTLALNLISVVPDRAFSSLGRLVVLHLNNNRIVSMGTSCFEGLNSLETLDLNYNRLEAFPSAVRSLTHLKELGFHSNSIQSIPENAFVGNPSLTTVIFHDNPIESVGRSAFQNLPELRSLSVLGAADLSEFPDLTGTKSLESLTITGTRITTLPSVICESAPMLQLLDLSDNQIQTLPSFSNCQNLHKIDLHHNKIEELQENTFTGMTLLHSLDLSWNRVTLVRLNSFSSLPALTKLDLSSNQLSSLPLSGLQSLTHLRLAGNDQLMELIPREDLPRVRVMEFPHSFQCCAFVSYDDDDDDDDEEESTHRNVSTFSRHDDLDEYLEFEDQQRPQHSVHCSPEPGPLRPCLFLLDGWLLRVGVWLTALVSLLGNALVGVSVFFSSSSSLTAPKLLVGLLGVANGLMGVWSGVMGAVDAWTYGRFWRYGVRWENSFLCRLSDFLFVFSSQTSLFLLTLAALQRLQEARRKSPRSPLLLLLPVALCFLLGVLLTLPPLLVGGGSSSSLCLPLPSSSSSSSLSLSVCLVLLDSFCFLLATFVLVSLFCRSDARPAAPWTRHVAWLLLSDFLLYVPVAFLSVCFLLRWNGAGPDVTKGVLLLVAPLPSCINPLLYLAFNTDGRRDVTELLAKLHHRRRRRGGGGACSINLTSDEDAEKQSCDSTQALVVAAAAEVKEEEEETLQSET